MPEEDHLSLPTIGTERPAVAEHDRLSCAPVLVIDLRAVFRRHHAHGLASLQLMPRLDDVRLPMPRTRAPRRLRLSLFANSKRKHCANAFVACRPPGHHAAPDRAMGFCLFNNVAVAARHLQAVHGIERVLIVDWDLHHGNGTQNIFYDDPTVLYVSSHQYPYYPGTGARDERGAGPGVGYTINLPLLPGTPAAEQVKLLLDVFSGPARDFQPQFILISCGFDAHRDDPMSALSLEASDYRALTRALVELAREHARGRLVSVLEGGYSLRALAESAAAHVQELVNGCACGAPPIT